MGTIRRLTADDYDAIAAVMDSRPYFQGRAVDQEFLDGMKKNYVKLRLPIPSVFFLGYFDDSGELVAFRAAHMLPAVGHVTMGVSYTKKGKASERFPGTQWPKAIIDLNHAMLDHFDNIGASTIWVIGPATPPKAGRLIEAPGTRLMDTTKYRREEDIPVKAGTFTGDEILDKFVLWGWAAPTDQVIMHFSVLFSKFQPPADAPPPTPRANVPHPPRGMMVGDGVFTSPPDPTK